MAKVYAVIQSKIGTVRFDNPSESFLGSNGGVGPEMDIDFVNAFVDWADGAYPPSQPTRIFELDAWAEVIPS